MSELTDTFGTIRKDSIIKIDNNDLTIENVWNTYCSSISIDNKYPDVEFSIPNGDITIMVFDGTNFINHKIKRLIRHKVFTCTTDITLSNGFKISVVDGCNLLSSAGYIKKFGRGISLGIPSIITDNKKSYCVDTDGNLFLIKISNINYVNINDYTYSFEIDNYHNFIANGIICGDFIKNN